MVDAIITALKEEYEKVGKMTIHRDKVHKFLDTTLDFTKLGKFIINMEIYLDKIMRDLFDDMNGEVTSPVA